MKKMIVMVVVLLVFSISNAMAAPLNDLATEQTAVGVSNDAIYIENKIADRITVGIQDIDLSRDDSIDFYGQYQFENNFRGIIGYRDTLYAGVGYVKELDNKWDGHAYVIFSDEFAEAQVGGTYKINHELDANVYYRFIMQDHGSDHGRLGVGLTFKF